MILRRGWLQISTILVIYLSLCIAQTIEKIHLNDVHYFNITDTKIGKKYYTATVVEKNRNVDLIVQLNNLSIDSDPDLAVFINTDKIPKQNTQPYCTSDQIGYDVCLVNDKDISEDMDLVVEVKCSTPCKYSLNLVYKERIEYDAQKGGSIDIILKNDEVREILVKIPKMNKGYSNMLLQAEFKNMYSFEYNEQAEFDFYGNRGERQPQNKNDAQLKSIWISDYIKVIPLSQEKREMCNDCSFSLEVKGPKNAIIQFSTILYDNERDLKLSEYFYNGVVEQEETQYFTIDFLDLLDYEIERIFQGENRKRKFLSDFLFNLIPYNGDPDLYVHYGETRPKDLDKYEWQSKTSFREDLILVTSDELNKKGYSSEKKIFIAVYGKQISAFQIRIDTYSNEYNSGIQLQLQQPVTSFVGKQKLTLYQLRVDGDLKREIEIILTSLQGNPDLFVKSWKYGEGADQTITLDEINQLVKNQYIDKEKKFVGWSVNKQGVDSIKIQYDPKKCNSDQEKNDDNNDNDDANRKKFPDNMFYNYCIFTIGILGNEERNRYVLKAASNDPSSIIPLRENSIEYAFLAQSEYRTYSFQPMSLDYDITEIKFQLSYNSGFASIVADRNYDNIKNKKPEKDFVHSSIKNLIVYNTDDLEKNKKLSDYTYFIYVKALEHTNAQLIVQVQRKGQKQLEFREVIQGVPTKLSIQPKSSGHIKFGFSYGVQQTIFAKSDQQIKLYVGEDKNVAPSSIYNKYNADSNIASTATEKRIELDQNFFSDEGYLYGTIENVSDKEINVVIYVQTDKVSLNLNESFQDILIPNLKRTYYFNIYSYMVQDISDTDKIYAYVVGSGIGLQQKIQGSFSVNNKTISTFKDYDQIKYIQADKQDVIKECPYLLDLNVYQDCQFQIEVMSPQEERITVSIVYPEKPTYISSYGQTVSQFPLKKEIRKFIYFLYEIKEVILTVQSQSYEFQVLGKILSYSQFQSSGAGQGEGFPTLNDDVKKLAIHTNSEVVQQIRIHPETYKGESCEQGCFLLISVIQPQESIVPDTKVIGNIIKLQLNGDKLYDLYEGEVVQGNVGKEEMVYYRLYVPQEKGNMKMIINLTPLDEGDPDLFLNKDSIKIPTRTEYDLNSQDLAGDFILVNNRTLKNSTGIAGYYIVGVYGNSNSTYQIQYQVGDNNIFKIDKNQIQQAYLHSNQTSYYIYHKKEKGKFTVVTNMVSGNSGDSYMFIKEYKNSDKSAKDFLSNLADPNSADLTTKNESHKEYIRWEDDSCDDCTYVIGIKSIQKQLVYSISINFDGGVAQIQNNKNQLIFLKQNISSKLRFFSQDDFNIYVSSYSGSCIDLSVKGGFAPQKQLTSTECKTTDPQGNGFTTKSIFIRHIFKDDQPLTGLAQQNTFTIELTSKFTDEKVLVQVVSGTENRLINSGIPLESVIAAKSEVRFIYYSSQEGMQSLIVNLSAENGQEYGLEETEIDMELINRKERPVIGNIVSKTKDLITMQFQTFRSQSYHIVVKYKGDRQYKFSILIKEQNTKNIPILSGFVLDVLPIHEVSNYQINMQLGSVLLIQNFNCISDQNIFIYTNANDMIMQNDKAIRVTRRATSNHEIQIIKDTAPQNPATSAIYIQKRANKQTKEKISKSIITTEVYKPKQPIIYDYIQIGDSGILTIRQDLNSYFVAFSELECVESDCWKIDGLKIVEIEYYLHISNSRETLQRQSYCSLYEPKDLIIKVNPLKKQSSSLMNPDKQLFTIEKSQIPEQQDKIYVSVTANVLVNTEPQTNKGFRFIYGSNLIENNNNIIQPKESDDSSSNLTVIVVICVLSIAILLLIIVQLYRRYKNMHKKLQYEMNDVRNVARSDIENESIPQGNQYNSILSEKGQSEMIEMK
ncbi:transmembrane protein, putative (macronuclear) [Tetrahymena thermophila SB210]|uniref:Transmembrane protein, putative n=1 Tax=Tetrahymena thermophila (strain SB210) TaxID=312017 RepID=I7MEH5_TETTS|nr:transmembrane protein, putative [Tetrahymena thermophila SB210]EAR96368.1 transmembrane protein, putative [Tetrahymena thermophila SB210]|eukprot:XP_001016613.1 transmembrane protein, putative [Tetrahymena thermophila SB210]